MDWSRAEAVGSVVGGVFAALMFFATIWPWPQIKQKRRAGGTFQGIYATKLIGVSLIASFALSGLAIYSAWGKETEFKHPPENELELVRGKIFTNEAVEIEGKNFEDCRFNNVRLLYHGKQTVSIHNNEFNGPLVLFTDNRGVSAFAEMLASFGAFRTEGVVWKSDTTGFTLVTNFPSGPPPPETKP